MLSNPQGFDHRIQCRVFDREIQSLIFPGNKAIDQNKFDSCKEYEHTNQIFAEMSLIQLVLRDIACQKLQ